MNNQNRSNSNYKKATQPRKNTSETMTLKQFCGISFGTHPLNRNISHKHVEEIKERILASGLKGFPAIIVSVKTHNILDGQHRLQAIHELLDESKMYLNEHIDVQWKYCNNLDDEFELIKAYNNEVKHWGSSDFFRSNKMVNDSYRRLESFIKECPRLRGGSSSSRAAHAIIFGKSYNRKDFNDGKFQMDNDDYKRGIKMYQEIERLLVYITDPEKVATYGKAPKIKLEEFACEWWAFRTTVGANVNMDEYIDELRGHEKMYNNMPKASRVYLAAIFDRIHKNMVGRKKKTKIRI